MATTMAPVSRLITLRSALTRVLISSMGGDLMAAALPDARIGGLYDLTGGAAPAAGWADKAAAGRWAGLVLGIYRVFLRFDFGMSGFPFLAI